MATMSLRRVGRPDSVSWGLFDLVGDAAVELWVLDASGEMVVYEPHNYSLWLRANWKFGTLAGRRSADCGPAK